MPNTKKIIGYSALTIVLLLICGYLGLYFYGQYHFRKIGYIPTYETTGDVTTRKDWLGTHVADSKNASLDELFDLISKKAGYHVYYPTYLPPELELNQESIYWHDDEDYGKNTIYYLENTQDTSSPKLPINQFYTGKPGDHPILEVITSLTTKKAVTINGNKGHAGTTKSGRSVLIFTTKDNVTFYMTSKSIGVDILIKIAESMH